MCGLTMTQKFCWSCKKESFSNLHCAYHPSTWIHIIIFRRQNHLWSREAPNEKIPRQLEAKSIDFGCKYPQQNWLKWNIIIQIHIYIYTLYIIQYIFIQKAHATSLLQIFTWKNRLWVFLLDSSQSSALCFTTKCYFTYWIFTLKTSLRNLLVQS